MDYELLGDTKFPHRFTFYDWEVTTVRATYTESSALEERTGNAGSVSEHHRDWILLPEATTQMSSQFANKTQLAESLEEFAERTDEMAVEASHSPIPLHHNSYPAERRRLGDNALKLAATIREVVEAEPNTTPSEEEIEQAVEEFRTDLEKHSRE